MNILIVYSTIEGQTQKIAQAVADFFEGRGWHAALVNAVNQMELGLERPDAAILLAPVHAGHYPTPFTHFIHQENGLLNSMPSAFVSVTLSIVSDLEDERQEAEDYPTGILAETGWVPLMIHHAAGALRLAEYDFFKRWMVRRLKKNVSGNTDAQGNREFTDWAALEAFCGEFANEVARRRK
jgi:menaquinone-dependent protoporphyrinogen oxidase